MAGVLSAPNGLGIAVPRKGFEGRTHDDLTATLPSRASLAPSGQVAWPSVVMDSLLGCCGRQGAGLLYGGIMRDVHLK